MGNTAEKEEIIAKFEKLRPDLQEKYIQQELAEMKTNFDNYFVPHKGDDGKPDGTYIKKFNHFPEVKLGALLVLIKRLGLNYN